MDPNKALARIRELVRKAVDELIDADEALELAETIDGLDKWLSGRGWLPRAWQEGR